MRPLREEVQVCDRPHGEKGVNHGAEQRLIITPVVTGKQVLDDVLARAEAFEPDTAGKTFLGPMLVNGAETVPAKLGARFASRFDGGESRHVFGRVGDAA
ncbi:MAG: hypothetical protein CL800_04270 [Citromicrobium sp.]|nr:hypothetical protein [Citromicrobium sp.]